MNSMVIVHGKDPGSSVRCAGDKALKDRWNSVGKTGKLTDAMRLVAAAKACGAEVEESWGNPWEEVMGD